MQDEDAGTEKRDKRENVGKRHEKDEGFVGLYGRYVTSADNSVKHAVENEKGGVKLGIAGILLRLCHDQQEDD